MCCPGQYTPKGHTVSAANDTSVHIPAPGLGYSPQCRMPVHGGRKHWEKPVPLIMK